MIQVDARLQKVLSAEEQLGTCTSNSLSLKYNDCNHSQDQDDLDHLYVLGTISLQM